MTERAPALLRKEFRWLPELAKRLPLPVPTPQRLSEPTPRFPGPWVIATWVPGEPADGAEISNVRQAGSDRCGAGLQTWGRAGRRILEYVFAFT
jgi:aminoglycoside phosphotransferase (APT) family kinase protein